MDSNTLDEVCGGYGLVGAGQDWAACIPAAFWVHSATLTDEKRKPLSAESKLVLLLLIRYAGSNDRAFASSKTMAGVLGFDIKTVKKALRTLYRAGLIEKQPRQGDGRYASNQYSLKPLWAFLAILEKANLKPEAIERARANLKAAKEKRLADSPREENRSAIASAAGKLSAAKRKQKKQTEVHSEGNSQCYQTI